MTGLFFTGATRLNATTYEAQRIDAAATYATSVVTTSVGYGRYEPQPDLGIFRRREGLSLNGSVLGDPELALARGRPVRPRQVQIRSRGSDLPVHLLDGIAIDSHTTALYRFAAVQTASTSFGINYTDECTVFDVSYSQSYADRQSGATKDTRTVMFRLELRTLGELSYSQNLDGSTVGDGVTSSR